MFGIECTEETIEALQLIAFSRGYKWLYDTEPKLWREAFAAIKHQGYVAFRPDKMCMCNYVCVQVYSFKDGVSLLCNMNVIKINDKTVMFDKFKKVFYFKNNETLSVDDLESLLQSIKLQA